MRLEGVLVDGPGEVRACGNGSEARRATAFACNFEQERRRYETLGAQANLRAAKEVAGYKRLVEHYMDEKHRSGAENDVFRRRLLDERRKINPFRARLVTR